MKCLVLVLSTSWSALALTGVASATSVSTDQSGPIGFGSSLTAAAPVGAGPSLLADDPATHTLYVTNGNNVNGPSAGGDTVSVIDTSRCAANDVSQCHGPWPTITVGNLPSGITVDRATDTVYVTSVGDGTVSVFDGATCNAEDTAGCGQTPVEVPVGKGPLGLVDDPDNHTVYVGNFGAPALGGQPAAHSTVSMIDTAVCNASHLAACPATSPPTVTVTGAPSSIAVNRRTHTVYVTTFGTARTANGWSVFDADTCNATVQAGCHSIAKLIGDPAGPNDGVVDAANDTLYTANYDSTISAYDLTSCNAADLTGCAADQPGTVRPFPSVGYEHDLYAVVDQRRHSVYVSFQGDDALAVVNTRKCGGANLSGCAALHPPIAHTGADPEGIVLDPSTQTLYTADEVDNAVSVIAAARCNAADTRGCRHPYPSVAMTYAGALATDDAAGTAYVTEGIDTVSMISMTTCNATRHGGCRQTPPSFTAGRNGTGVAIDAATHTVYIADYGRPTARFGTISVVDDRTCNASDQSGCGHARTLHVYRGHPVDIAVDQQTGTLYVASEAVGRSPNFIAVFNAATCDAERAAGCDQAPARLPVAAGTQGGQGLDLAMNEATDTVYATNKPYADPTGSLVYVFNGATCNAQDFSGCDQTPATIDVGNDPAGLAVAPGTDTVYAVVHRQGDYPASVAVINGATCNGSDTTGCGQTPVLTPAGFGALFDAVDPATQQLFTTDLQNESLSVIDGASCDATDASGCGGAPAEDAVGDHPAALAVDSQRATVYVASPAGVSVVPIRP